MVEKMWMVRAGESAFLVQDFEEKDYVAVGWTALANLSQVKSKDALEKVYKEAYPDISLPKLRMGVGQLARFRFEMKKGDRVVTYNPEFRVYPVGEIISDYEYVPESPGNYNHIRRVKWIGKVSRDSLSVTGRNSLGAIMTLFLLSDSATQEFEQLLSGKAPADIKTENEEPELDEYKKDIRDRAREYIKDKIVRLDWDEMQDLVAGILGAMGYKAKPTPPGPDRGADIIASPDGLGLEQPRIKVEVKHKQGAVGAPMLRSFTGGLRQNDRGLYVSTGGFTKEARYEADRSNVPITLIDLDELVELLTQNYEKADQETKAMIPLVKLYWPA
jgi:restriction system protein